MAYQLLGFSQRRGYHHQGRTALEAGAAFLVGVVGHREYLYRKHGQRHFKLHSKCSRLIE